MQDGGMDTWSKGFVQCSIRCKTERDLAIHIQRNHTPEGLANKLESEQKLATFLKRNEIPFDHDWANRLNFTGCKNIEGARKSARLDFFLPVESTRLGCVVVIENNEWQHVGPSYACDLQRIFNCGNALENTEEYRGTKLLIINFNPHHYLRDGVRRSHTLQSSHELLLKTLRDLTPEDIRTGTNLIYIHYDETGGELEIFLDPDNDFAPLFHDQVIRHI